ncbi:MAG: orotate phosphoribosyltransferase [Nitrospinae bacterium]|nr:orotate phosphoribosyltransferase [Nitrospinota bacterium]
MIMKKRLIELLKERAYKKTDTPSFKLTSGKMSSHYVNCKMVTYNPEGQYLIGNIILNHIKEKGLKVKGAGGLTLGADPIATAISFASHGSENPIEAFVIRKEKKGYGAGNQIEGDIHEGDSVIILDDVLTTGKSTIKAIDVAEENKLNIQHVFVLVDREEENGYENVRARGYDVTPIVRISELQ